MKFHKEESEVGLFITAGLHYEDRQMHTFQLNLDLFPGDVLPRLEGEGIYQGKPGFGHLRV